MRALVYGGRDFKNYITLWKVLDQLDKQHKFTCIIDGMAKSADTFAFQWALTNGVATERYPAKWEVYGKAAGPMRNLQMRDEGKPDIGIEFPGGLGTRHMTRSLKEAGVKVLKVELK